jgi:hypothetical protein
MRFMPWLLRPPMLIKRLCPQIIFRHSAEAVVDDTYTCRLFIFISIFHLLIQSEVYDDTQHISTYYSPQTGWDCTPSCAAFNYTLLHVHVLFPDCSMTTKDNHRCKWCASASLFASIVKFIFYFVHPRSIIVLIITVLLSSGHSRSGISEAHWLPTHSPRWQTVTNDSDHRQCHRTATSLEMSYILVSI